MAKLSPQTSMEFGTSFDMIASIYFSVIITNTAIIAIVIVISDGSSSSTSGVSTTI